MTFGMRNAGATFARLVQKVLGGQFGRNIEAYVDDIVVRSKKEVEHMGDLEETFLHLRKVGIRLNAEKCVFGVRAGKLLGYLVSKHGIEANPEKIQAILRMAPPSSQKELQKLTGRLNSLGRFIPRSAEKNLPFFKALRGAQPFRWMAEQQLAFDKIKEDNTKLMTLASPSPGSSLLLYVAATPVAVSAALIQEKESEGSKH